MSTPRRVLFLCTGNSCRSQMAEGWLRHLGGAAYQAYSAGLQPHGLNPLAVAVMAEVGIDLAGHTSDPLERYASTPIDDFITVCNRAAETCPLTPPGSRTLHWSFDDPPTLAREQGLTGEAELAVYRRVRDEIRAAVERYLAASPQQGGAD
ncbi:MAG: arsenate reductase ArsC [Fimbriimonadaceae bacterium]|nr:arsenate reductase ArsC [Fimbriimonadaceae bacterium]